MYCIVLHWYLQHPCGFHHLHCYNCPEQSTAEDLTELTMTHAYIRGHVTMDVHQIRRLVHMPCWRSERVLKSDSVEVSDLENNYPVNHGILLFSRQMQVNW